MTADLGAGDEWFEEIQGAMDDAQVAVVLISAHSLKSKFIRHQEIPHLLDRRANEGMTFFPVIVKSCAWDDLPWLSRFQARPQDGRPLAEFSRERRDAELTKIAKEILGIVRNGRPVLGLSSRQIPEAHVLAPLHQLPTPPARLHRPQGGSGLPALQAVRSDRGNLRPSRNGRRRQDHSGPKLAEELKPQFPDAQIYLDLKGVDPQPLTAAQAMAHVIRAFHPGPEPPESEAEVAGQLSIRARREARPSAHGQRGQKRAGRATIPPSACLLW